jgi:tetratricopeptide (TPR) repeat protein
MEQLEALLTAYPQDARLHFMKGSLLAGSEDYAAARVSMRRAVDLAPDFAVARFQLGFLLLTSGEPYPAQEAWGPLHALPKNHYLRLFVDGLCHLIRDEFEDTIRMLEAGIAGNSENLPMNRDMQLIINEVRSKLGASQDTATSSVDQLLQQAAFKGTRH